MATKLTQHAVILGLILLVLVQATNGDVNDQCKTKCSDSPPPSTSNGCNETCRVEACQDGCKLWDNSTLIDGCSQSCNQSYSDETFKVQYCSRGCSYYEQAYAMAILAADPKTAPIRLGLPTSSSIVIMWEGSSNSEVFYNVQWQYAEIDGSSWSTFNSTFETEMNVTGLMPFTSYIFRVQWVVFSPAYTALTPESEKLQTEANGPPIDAPVITNLISPSSTTIIVEWSGVQFPAGPIVGHDLTIESSILERTSVRPNVFSHVFTDQLPNTTYNVSVAARNSFGPGPLRAQSVTTLGAESDNSTTPYLVVSVERSRFYPPYAPVSAVELLPIPYEDLETSKTIHLISNESSKILDVAVHYDKSYLFFIDEMGTIHRKNISDLSTAVNETLTEEILVGSSTTRIDVDWLYDEIYYIEGVSISKCSIDGTGVTLAVGPLDDAPTELTVDPFNGYLFWADSTGIFRLDLQDVRNGNFDMKERILEIANASAFTVDPSSYEIFFSNPLMQTIGKAQLDGSEMIDERPSDSRHENMTNLERYGGLFHWTEETEDRGTCGINGMITNTGSLLFETGEPILVTEYGGFFCVHGYGGLDILHPSSQPFPVPLVAPQGLQVLFDVTLAQLSWQPVKRLESKGKGAWDRWSYEVEMTTSQSGKVDKIYMGVGMTLKVAGLDADTDYIFRVRALSQAGNGPWSAQFGGRTFTATTPEAFILMATNSSVVKTGLDGDNVENLHVLNDNIIDLAWTQDYAFWVHGNGQEMFSLSLVGSGSTPRPLAGHTSTSIRALAADWIGGKMYWSDNDRNEISRADLNLTESTLSNQEVIVEFRSVRDLALDSVNGYIYWTEERRIEAARLNGQEVETISEYSDFADEEIAGLTLDFVSGKVFWFVIGSSNGNSEFQLFNADLRHISKNPPSGPQTINSNTMQATLHFFSDKLFWVDTGNRLVIQQLSREELSFIPSDPVYEVTVVQNSTLQPYPDGFNKAPNVRPNNINPTDIVIASGGVWDDFTVEWSDSPEVDHGVVWYRVLITSADSSYGYDAVQMENEVRITALEPFIDITVEVSAFTYWHVSAAADQMLTSPMAAPTVPQNERLFINEDYNIMTGESEFTAVFRWEKESDTNGILDKYIVYWGTDSNSLVGEDVTSTTFEFTLPLSTTDTYFFQVAGVTQGGTGVATPLLSGSKNVPTFPPTFLSPIDDGYNIVDSDTGEVTPGPDEADVVTYHTESQTWYYFYENFLKKMTSDEPKRNLFNLNNEEKPQQDSVTLDWISLRLYYAVGTSIYMFDFTKETDLEVEREPLAVSVNGDIKGLVISPNDNLLIWSEVDATLGTTLKSYQLDGPGQTRRKRQSDVSSCNISIAGAFALDTSNSSRSRLYYVEKDSNNIWVSDSNGCNGNIFFDSSTQTQSGLPASFMTVDQDKLYWTNTTLQTLASIDKLTGENFQIKDSDTTVIIATGRHLQPYPDPDCLIPAGPITEPSLTEAFANSLHLQIEPVSTNSICGSVSLATPVYTVLYASNCSGFDEGDSVETTDLTVMLDNFEPYTDYCLLLMVANKYTSDDQSSNLTSDPVTYKTWVGVPSAPRNVIFVALSYDQVALSWDEPEELNGPQDSLVYEVDRNEIIATTKDTSAEITGLNAATTYRFKVGVKHDNAKSDVQGISEPLEGTTFERPDSIYRDSSTHYSIEVCWTSAGDGSIQKYRLEHRFINSPVSDESEESTFTTGPEEPVAPDPALEYCTTIGSVTEPLRPYSTYEIQLQAQYTSGVWYNNAVSPSDIMIDEMTEGDAPGVIIDLEVENDVVSWSQPERRGPGQLNYTLEAKESSGEANVAKRATGDWQQVYTGTKTTWSIDLEEDVMFVYRVAASNDIGTGSFSPDSEPYKKVPATPESNIGIIIGAVIGGVVILVLLILVICCVIRRKEEKNRNFGGPVSYQADTELATLRDYPTTMEGNQLYALTTTADGKEAKLPLFARERLKLLTFLGSGAFGEVFEGVALNILTETSGKTKVAVKTLKKGSNDEEKEDFLKEAILMSNFHHANIISLLGVCLDNDPQYLILELMEGGDLLSYLRAARSTQETNPNLTEADLVDIVTDVARGCKYLEEMHFVHRDLAARNCLVSCKGYEDAKCRIVKIGDFGLARDIYKSDYYRKEGEGLLPVRWMAPEALIDGLFTNSSDIWAFGVLVWEVFTFGQQPYPARTNIEVLKFVTEGGRLERPQECVEDMYALMMKCWEKSAKVRPSFLIILDRCENFRRKSYGPGYDNDAFLDEKINYSKVNQSLNTDDYLEPMDKNDLKQKPPNLVVDDNGNAKVPASGEKKREGSFRRLLPGGGDSGPKSPQPRLEAAAEQRSWNQNKTAIDERYLAMPVGRSVSSVQTGTKPEVKPSVNVARGESVNIPAGSTPRLQESGSKKRRAPASPSASNTNFGMPNRPAPIPPSPSSRGSSEPHSRTSSQSSVSKPNGPPHGRSSSKKAAAPRPPPRADSSPQQNGEPQTGGRQPNPFRQFSEDGDSNKLQVEYYNV